VREFKGRMSATLKKQEIVAESILLASRYGRTQAYAAASGSLSQVKAFLISGSLSKLFVQRSSPKDS
jgi:hypothetical protein